MSRRRTGQAHTLEHTQANTRTGRRAMASREERKTRVGTLELRECPLASDPDVFDGPDDLTR
jgi:hypothetical protein